ncbi:diguanylate cyclase [Neptuniibacter halophilus]|uniref:diguanylate cyclase n=1 Tax=Neptuniibacter halophilus TaxID=651666 RepID=UPI00257279F5|nr:diguanylate cyclase [Neptuniibacter halophilus]
MDNESNAILVVEDDPVCLNLLCELLFSTGFEPVVATHGQSAIERLDREYELIMLDLSLPDMSGLEVLEQIRQNDRYQDTPVICVTASDMDADISRAFSLGAMDYVIKPYNNHVLLSKVSTFVDWKQKTQRLKDLSTIDKLTGVDNRHRLDEILSNEWRRAARSSSPLSVIMVDMDNFKAINDGHGHQAGDECLQAVANVLKATIRRAGDYVIRYGGDEFTLVLANTDKNAAVQLAEKIRTQVSGENPACQQLNSFLTPLQLSVTLGVATEEKPAPEASPDSLIHNADSVLVAGKGRGEKNAVHS